MALHRLAHVPASHPLSTPWGSLQLGLAWSDDMMLAGLVPVASKNVSANIPGRSTDVLSPIYDLHTYRHPPAPSDHYGRCNMIADAAINIYNVYTRMGNPEWAIIWIWIRIFCTLSLQIYKTVDIFILGGHRPLCQEYRKLYTKVLSGYPHYRRDVKGRYMTSQSTLNAE